MTKVFLSCWFKKLHSFIRDIHGTISVEIGGFNKKKLLLKLCSSGLDFSFPIEIKTEIICLIIYCYFIFTFEGSKIKKGILFDNGPGLDSQNQQLLETRSEDISF